MRREPQEPIAVEVINGVPIKFLSDPMETALECVEMFVKLFFGGCEKQNQDQLKGVNDDCRADPERSIPSWA